VPQLVMNGNEVLVADLDAHLMRRSSLKSGSQALAWQTTSRSLGLVKSDRSQKVGGSGSKPRDL